MKYFVTDLPTDPTQRATRIAFERAQCGTLYRRPDGSVVLVRASWPFPSASLIAIEAVPGDWVEIIS